MNEGQKDRRRRAGEWIKGWFVLNKGLKKVNIGQDEWFFGKSSTASNPATGKKDQHMVIYGPGRDEYHVWGKDVDFIRGVHYGYYDEEISGSYVNRHGNDGNNGLAKVYILTHILDNKDNWCFDLDFNKVPLGYSTLKVVFDTGTVRWVDFNHETSVSLLSMLYSSKPIAYRKPKP